MYCLRSGRPSNIEHLIPAGLGPHADIVLPAGAVCESCNHWLGRQVDEALVHLFEVLLIRGIFRVRDREGRTIDRLELDNGYVDFTGTEEVLNVVVNGDHLEERDGKTLMVTLVSKRKHSGAQWRRATRAVLKIGLGLSYLQYGPATALGRDFDPVRAAICGEPYEGYLLIGKFELLQWPHLNVSLLYDIPGMQAAVQLRYGGLDLIADLGLGPASGDVRGWAQQHGYQVMDIAPRAA
jgi:hypothetical protein